MASSGKGWQGNFFEDFELGAEVACPTPRRLGEGEVAAYIALTGDRTPRFSGREGLVHPLAVFHTVMGQTVRQVSLNARANLGYAGMVFRRPVRVGSTLSTRFEVVGLKENSNNKTGIVWIKTVGRDEAGEVVLDYTRWVMVKKRSAEPTRWLEAAVVPELPSSVAPEALYRDFDRLPRSEETGAAWRYEDYAPGERVFHHDGQTVNPSDHMSFTRLFQNSAKVHFDTVLTGGKPLVYGGVPISVAYAQAYNGFENRLGVAAINGGQHTAPLHAGDTLYSFTEVEAVDPLGDGPVGALRCHLYALKNHNPADEPDLVVKPDGKRYREDVVLDLDFWELVPKREA